MRRVRSVQGSRAGGSASQREAVELAERYVGAHIDTSVSVARLSRVVGLSERGLRQAFQNVRGVSPKRYMVLERLQHARWALTRASASPTTVTHIACDYGFSELGRFAASYRHAFGEPPSRTLRTTRHMPSN